MFEPEPEQSPEELYAGFTMLVGVDASNDGDYRRCGGQSPVECIERAGAEEGDPKGQPSLAEADGHQDASSSTTSDGPTESSSQSASDATITREDWLQGLSDGSG